MAVPTRQRLQAFVKLVLQHYAVAGRHTLPWRHTSDPYAILVSEVMLQQTQVDRVVPKYLAFMKQFPTPAVLAQAPLSLVLKLWAGLGYNRRAIYLKKAAQALTSQVEYPQSVPEWQRLPGIGPYTAAAVSAFAFNQPVPLIETNVRTVYLHHFFADTETVTDTAILELVSLSLMYVDSPRTWYYALMDYGSVLKKQVGNLNKKSTTYRKQSRFKGSNREVRGALVRALTEGPKTKRQLMKLLPMVSLETLDAQILALSKEGLLQKDRQLYLIAT